MKTTLSLICIFYLLVPYSFGQEDNHPFLSKQNHDRRLLDKFTAPVDNIHPNRTRIGDRDIPITTHDGQSPDEQQLNLIQNVLTEDFLVNDDTVYNNTIAFHQNPSTAMDSAGNFIVVWSDRRNSQNYDIYFQRYNLNGEALGQNIKANDDEGNANQYLPKIAMDSQGNFVIVWQDGRNGYSDIYYQQYNSSGAAQGTNSKVNDDNGSTSQGYPSISMNSQGNFVVVWGSDGLFFQRYDSSGTALGMNNKVTTGTLGAWQRNPAIAMDSQGNFMIVWQENTVNNPDIFCQRYDSSGIAQGSNIRVNDDAGNSQQDSPSISMSSLGNFVIVWEDERNGDPDLYFQQYKSNSVKQGVNIKVNDDARNSWKFCSSISVSSLGNFVIVWSEGDIYFQQYNSAGTAQGINCKVNDDIGNKGQNYPSISMSSQGNFVIAWEDCRNSRGTFSDINWQRYDYNSTAQGINCKANDDAGGAVQNYPSISMDLQGNFIIVWEDERNGNWDIYYQRYDSNGLAHGTNTKVNNDTGSASKMHPSISMDLQGNFVIVWEDYRKDPYNYDVEADIYFQRYNSSGIAQGTNSKVNDNGDAFKPSISIDSRGNFVIAWKGVSGTLWDVYFQRYNAEGIAQGTNTKVNDDGVADYPSISMDSQGNFVIVWSRIIFRGEDDSWEDICIKRYNSVGEPQGIISKVNGIDSTTLGRPSISMDSLGNFVIVWKDSRNHNLDIYSQRFDLNGTAQGTNSKVNEDTGSVYHSPSISMDSWGNFVIVWEDFRYNAFYPDIIGQRYFADGSPNGGNYRIVKDGQNHGETYPAVTAKNDKIIFSWMDNRNSKGWDIYAKIVDWDWEGEIPVEMISFEGTTSENDVLLNWTTATETNNLGFEIQKKVNDEFVKIAFVNGHGTTSQVSNYSFVEKDVTLGKYSYRLKQIDYDGTYKFSSIVEVSIGGPKTFSLSQNYPNPFNPVTKIKFSIPSNLPDGKAGVKREMSNVLLKVYDILGNEIATLVNEVKPAGSYEIDFSAANLPSGVYFYQLKAGDLIETKKMLLLR